MPLPTPRPKLNTGITIDGKIKALADLVATHERRTFASLVEHAIWLYVQKRLPSEEMERILKLLSSPSAKAQPSLKYSASSKAPLATPPVSRRHLPEAPAPVQRRKAPGATTATKPTPTPGSKKASPKPAPKPKPPVKGKAGKKARTAKR